jgi:hypothetical protein
MTLRPRAARAVAEELDAVAREQAGGVARAGGRAVRVGGDVGLVPFKRDARL